MHYCKLMKFDTMEGPGIRVSLWVSGCSIHCNKCFNRQAWDYNYGQEYTEETEKRILMYLSDDGIDGISILGGEPFDDVNWETVYGLVKKIKETLPEKSVLVYTGYLKEDLEKTEKKSLVDMIDILIDGPYVHELQNLNLNYRGSSNQRIIYLTGKQK